MTIFLFGSGVLGKYLYDCISPFNDVSMIPGRSHSRLLESLSTLGPSDYVIDLLDPASFDLITPNIIANILSFRELLLKKTVAKYIYVSSSSVYQPSRELLTEISPTINANRPSETYPCHKLKSERLVSCLCTSSFITARLPSLWSSKLSENKGFFLDLFRSYRLSNQLSKRLGDEFVFSFMSYSRAASLLSSLLFSDLRGLVNLPSKTYSSRSALKTRQHPPDLPAEGKILSTLRHFDFDIDSETFEDSWVYW